jgi:hypothetical protein
MGGVFENAKHLAALKRGFFLARGRFGKQQIHFQGEKIFSAAQKKLNFLCWLVKQRNPDGTVKGIDFTNPPPHHGSPTPSKLF